MPENYAVRMRPDGKKDYYRTKRDYEYGKLSSFGRATKSSKK